MAEINSLEWVNHIEQDMKIYLNRKHRALGISPIEGDKKEKEKSITYLYLNKYKKLNKLKRKPKFKVGDTVRIWGERLQFLVGIWRILQVSFYNYKVLSNLP